MNRRLYILIAILAICCFNAVAQTVKVGGTIVDEKGEPIELATVRIEGTTIGTVSNLKGHYSLKFNSRDSVVLVYSMMGYNTRKRTLHNPKGNISLNVILPTLDFELGEVTITEHRKQTTTMQNIDVVNNRIMPDASGGSIESIISLQAGVSSNNELSSTYNVRGGSYDENMVYVNGVEVYRPLLVSSGQQEGLSFVNPDMTANVTFSSGGFEAKYGDKMSSVLDITYKKPEQTEGKVSVSMLGASVYVGTGGKKWSWINGLRYKSNRYLLGTLDTNGEYDPSFVDYQTAFNYQLTKRLSLEVMGNISENKYRFTPVDRTTKYGTMSDVREFKVYFDGFENDLFRTLFVAGGLNYKLSNSTALTFRVSSYQAKEQETYDITGQYWLNALDDTDDTGDATSGVGTYMEHARNYLKSNVSAYSLSGVTVKEHHRIGWGLELKSEKIKDRLREWEMRDSAGYSLPQTAGGPNVVYTLTSSNNISSTKLAVFVQDSYKFKRKAGLFTLTAGVRGSYWSWNKDFLLSPRASLALTPSGNDRFTIRVATGVYYQTPFYKEFRDTTTVDGVAYVSLNRDIKSQRSVQFLAGGDYSFRMAGRPFKFTAEAYYKALSNLIPYNVDNVKVSYYGRNMASGYATGLDMKIFGEFVPETDSWLTFSVMKTEEKINGKWLPRPTDQRYNLSLYFTDYFPGTKKWILALKGSLAGGLPFGPPHSGREESVFRAPAYKRVDIGMSRVLLDRMKKDGAPRKYVKSLLVGVDVFNLLNISNVNSYYWVTDVSGEQFAVPNYLTSRQINVRFTLDF